MSSIFHYTGLTGLQGIIQRGSPRGERIIYASHISFLNDSAEIKLGGRHAVYDYVKGDSSLTEDEKLALSAREFSSWESNYETYVVSFTRKGDSLRHWAMYGPQFGYCLEFDRREFLGGIERCQEGLHSVLKDVRYERSLPEGNVARRPKWGEVSDDHFRAFERAESTVNRLFGAGDSYLQSRAALIKDSAFADEDEVRLVVGGYASEERPKSRGIRDLPRVHFRQGQLGLTPFLKLVWNDGNGESALRSITVGPGGGAKVGCALTRSRFLLGRRDLVA